MDGFGVALTLLSGGTWGLCVVSNRRAEISVRRGSLSRFLLHALSPTKGSETLEGSVRRLYLQDSLGEHTC
jgi:hypothetical protein